MGTDSFLIVHQAKEFAFTIMAVAPCGPVGFIPDDEFHRWQAMGMLGFPDNPKRMVGGQNDRQGSIGNFGNDP